MEIDGYTIIRELGKEQTLLISSHILPEVELLCDRVIIIDRGQIVAEGTPRDLRDSWLGNAVVSLELKEDAADAVEVLSALDGVKGVRRAADHAYELECQPQTDPREQVFRVAVEKGWVLLELKEQTASLEDIFVRLTTQEQSQVSEQDAGSTAEDGELS